MRLLSELAQESGDIDSIRLERTAVFDVELPDQFRPGQVLVRVATIRPLIFLENLTQGRVEGAAVFFKFCV